MRIPSTFFALSVAALAIAGCGGDGPNALDLSHVGEYELTSVNGDPVPAVVIDEPDFTLMVTEGGMTLRPDNSFTETLTVEVSANGGPPELQAAVCHGSYHRSGNTVTLTTPATNICVGEQVTGTLSGNTLSVDYDGDILVFTRQ